MPLPLSIQEITIREEPRLSDIDAVVSLHSKQYHEGFPFGLGFEKYVAETFAEFIHNFTPGKDRMWMAEHNEKPIGFISLVHRSRKVGQLRYFVIAPDYRGLGLGRLLFGRCLEAANALGYSMVYLWTTDLLTQATEMYRKAGFVMVHEAASSSFGVKLLEQRYELKLNG